MSETISENPRAKIDRIDSEILRLLNERAAIALRVGEIKRSGDKSLCDPTREREVLARLQKENSGPFDEQSIADIFQRIIDESLHLQQKTFISRSPRPSRKRISGIYQAIGASLSGRARHVQRDSSDCRFGRSLRDGFVSDV
jgi:chorismate mutase-like protein